MIFQGKRLASDTLFYSDSVNFYLADHGPRGERLHVSKIEFEPVAEGYPVPPSFSLPMESAQEFFEQMWAQGFRSKHDKGNSEALDAARREHIGDLRKAAKLA